MLKGLARGNITLWAACKQWVCNVCLRGSQQVSKWSLWTIGLRWYEPISSNRAEQGCFDIISNHTETQIMISKNWPCLVKMRLLMSLPSPNMLVGNKCTNAHLSWKSRRVSRSKTRQSIRHHHHSFTISPYRVTVGLHGGHYIRALYFGLSIISEFSTYLSHELKKISIL